MKACFHTGRLALMALLILALAALPALAQDVTVSNEISVEDLVLLATEAEEATQEDEDSVRVKVQWLPDDSAAPESVILVIIGSNGLQRVTLGQSNDWEQTVRLAPSGIDRIYVIPGFDRFEVEAGESSLTVTVTLTDPDQEETSDLPLVESEPSSRSISIHVNVGPEGTVDYGEEVVLNAVLTGYEDLEVVLAWQYDSGSGWQYIDGANGFSYSFLLTEENVAWLYRVEVIITE